MKYLYGGISLQNKRPSNMDSLLLKSRVIDGKSVLLAVVCDGVGSLADGAFASANAILMLDDWFERQASTERIGLTLRDAVMDINSSIVANAKAYSLDTATTLSALLLLEDEYYVVHTGDSRIYSYSDGVLLIHTGDDVSESGKLTSCIGLLEGILLQYSEGPIAGKTFLLCSDGLYKRMDESLLALKMQNWNRRSLNEKIEDLAQYVIERGEKDNITLAMVKINI